MVLEIYHHNNHYHVKGQLTRPNLQTFYREFNNIFDSLNTLVLNIEKVEKIDREGVNAIAKLHNISIAKGKKLAIIGLGCNALYDHFKSTEAA